MVALNPIGQVYVTVGTTRFDALIREITNDVVLKALKARGCRKLVVQYGKGNAVNAQRIREQYGIDVDQYDFKVETIRTDIVNADLVIGHGGAGTCMDVLHYQKPALIVINQKLMGNHQAELATQLSEDGHIYHCEVHQVAKKIATLDFSILKPYESKPENMKTFVNFLNDLMFS